MTSQNIENIYKLAPLQSGMLFHTIYDSSGENPYVAQTLDEFVGRLDLGCLRRAWQAVVDRHTILRSAFVWEGVDVPLQVVRGRVEVPFEEADWRGFDEGEQERLLERLLSEDRARGFELDRAPLLRFTLIRTAEERTLVLRSFHHLLLDGWSSQLIEKEFFALYRAELSGVPAGLGEAVPYVRYVDWLEEQSRPEAEQFWRGYLAGLEGPTALGVDRVTGLAGFGDVEFELGEELSSRMREFARAHRVTVNTVVQGVWSLLLSRYSGGEDVLYGSTVSGRPAELPGVESMVGLFINTLPVRASVPAGADVVEWLRGLQEQQVELRQYEYSSLVDVQRYSGVPSGQRLFDSILVFENYPKLVGGKDLPNDLQVEGHRGIARTDYPLTLAASYLDDLLGVNISFDRGLFEVASVERMAGHFRRLLASVVDGAGSRVGELVMLTDEESAALTGWAEGPVAGRDTATLHALVEEQAHLHPSSTAVSFGDTQLTYQELNERANQLAHHLRGSGVEAGTLVGVCLDRGPDLSVALLGVLKAGGAYLPLDPQYPLERLEFMLTDAAATIVVTQDNLAERVSGDGRTLITLDKQNDILAGQPVTDPAALSGPDDLAYVIYTSGSTGRPKGVQIEHRSVVNRLRGTDSDFAFDNHDVWTFFHSFAFDFSVWEIWGALCYGGRLVIVDQDTSRNAEAFAQLLVQEQVTVLNQTPSAFEVLQRAVLDGGLTDRTALRLVVFGGEALRPARLTDWFEAHGTSGPRMVNMYGITETTIHVTAREITAADTTAGTVSPIGRPLADTSVFVLDTTGTTVPIGVAGELWVGGTGVARGYLNRPELTTERFTEREISGQLHRLYRTGDVVRWLTDGELEYLGRADDQVKVRGFRIELGEIEAVLSTHPKVTANTVITREDTPGDKRLVAYLVPADTEPTLTELREWCAQDLPAYMVPSTFVLLDALPLTTNGKTDRKALPAPDNTRPDLAATYLAPRTPTEETLAQVWADVLGLDKVGVLDNFFELGGDSILSIQAVSRARRHGIQLTPRMIFQHQTIATIADATASVTPAASSTVEAEAKPLRESYELAPLQSGMLFHTLYDTTDVSPYAVQFLDEFVGRLDLGCLRRAWQAVVDRHTILRSAFVWEGVDVPLQVVRGRVEVPFEEADWRGFDEGEQERLLERLLSEDRARGFELDRAPLLRFTLIRTAEERTLVLWSFHHLVLDGWSAQLAQKEFFALYRAELSGVPAGLGEAVPYVRYVDWLEEQSRPEAEQFWRGYLAGLEGPTALGVDRVTGLAGFGDVEFELGEELSSRMREFARAHRVTVNTVVQGVWSLLLSRYSGGEDVLYGSTVSGRPAELPGVESMVGLFINTLPVRASVPAGADVVEWLRGLQEQQVELRQYEYSSLVDVQRYSGVPSGQRLFDSILVFENFPKVATDEIPSGLTRYVRRDVERTGYPITVVSYLSKRFGVNISFDRGLFEVASVERMAGHFRRLLASVVDGAGSRVGELVMLTDEESAALTGWAEGPVAGRDTATLHALVEEQAHLHPSSTAVSFGDTQLTYQELNERANQLAHHLRGSGVEAGTLVGVCLDRGPDLSVALLGVLKAGGAYLPLDPQYPLERLEFMLTDAAATIVVTQDNLAERVSGDGRTLITLDKQNDILAGQPVTDPAALSGPDDLAYVIYTSGSTGRPKGVQIEHRSVVNRLRGTDSDFAFDNHDVWTFFHSFAFDFSVWEIWGALCYGGRLVIVDQDTSRNAEAFAQLLVQEQVTVLNQTPSAFEVLQRAVLDGGLTDRTALRLVVFGGEALRPARLTDWFEAHGTSGPRMVNMYGITETTIHVTAREITAADTTAGTVSPIGRPLADTSVFVLDTTGTTVPIGVAGELWVGGTGVARGYLNRPELTTERFTEREISGQLHRLYRTGDVVRWLTDGELEYLGRADDQVKVRGFRIELGEIEAVLSTHPKVTANTVITREDTPGDKRLVAYLVPADTEPTLTELREWCAQDLPAYMVPSTFVLLDALPLTTNGKTDRKALPAPDNTRPDLAATYLAPRTPTEETLAQVWADVLGLDKVGVLDNFFELGGDSILSIQAVSRARRHGIQLTPRMIFQHQTIATIADAVPDQTPVQAEQGPVVGDLPLTPIQHWYFEQQPAVPGHFNQARLLVTDGIDAEVLTEALAAVVHHHDALRLRFVQDEGQWRQEHTAEHLATPVERHDLSALADSEVREALRERADAVHRSLDLARGPLVRSALFELGAGRGQRLLLVMHHLVVDGVSWRILLEDLGEVYRALIAGEPVALPAKTSSYQAWSRRLAQYAGSEQVGEELTAWMGATVTGLPRDRQGSNTFESLASVSVALDPAETESLLRHVPRAFGTRINDVLLTALAHAVKDWSGGDEVLVDLEGHGREDLFPELDVSRTVGWFTSIFPVRLVTGGNPVASLPGIQAQLSAVPNRGIGYGVLRHLSADAEVRTVIDALPRPEIGFNYLGQFEGSVASIGRHAPDEEPRGLGVDPRTERAHLIEVVVAVCDGRMVIEVMYSAEVHEDATAQAFATGLVTALREILCAEPTRRTALVSRGAEEIYRLTPLQSGMFFQSLSDASDVRPYIVQFLDEFTGRFEPAVFRRAWQRVIDRHAILRSAFVWEGVEEPYQAVSPQVEVAITELDWRHSDEAGQQELLAGLLTEDRERGFDLDQASPFRFTLLRVAEDRTVVLWSFHHLLLDGWSAQLVQKEFYAFYRAETEGTTASAESALGAPVPYGRYIEWLEDRSPAEAEAFWRRYLAGLEAPTTLGVDRETGLTGFGDVERTVDGELVRRLDEFTRKHRITANTVLQGAWALLLSHYSGGEDVLFGSTVSGRPVDLPDVESMVGLFINTLPVRAVVPGGEPMVGWLRGLQENHAELRQYEYSALSDVHRWSEVPKSEALFRSILIFENYPKLLGGDDLPDGLTRKRLGYVERTGYPLVLGVALSGNELDLHLVHDRSQIDDAAAARMVDHLQQLLTGIVAGDAGTLLDELDLLTEQELAQLARWNGETVVYPDDVPVHELIERQAHLSPEAVAVEFGEELLSYGDLNRRANQLAHHLRGRGVGPEVIVGLCVERGIDMIVALLGIMKSGGAYVPLDTQYPADRLAFMIEDTAAPVVVTQRHLSDRLPENGPGYVYLDADTAVLAAEPDADPEPLSGPDHLAYVIFTSGSTGRPKGVMIEHRSMSDRVQEMRRQYRLTADDAYLQFSSVTFDGSVGEIFPTLVAGARLVPRGDDWTPRQVLETIRDKCITVCQLPPFVWNELISQLTSAAELGVRLRLMSMGGERVLAASVERWFRRTSVPLFNIYGPTETTVNMTTCLITRPAAIVPIGAPVANTDVLVVDRSGRPAPLGVPGELWIGGKGVARGYLNQSGLTAERFVQAPRPADPSARMYRTGDLVRWLPDGQLDFLGRIDDQVKLRGFRIELGEIESVLTSHPQVKSGVVLLREDDPGVRRLVAYCVPAAEERPGASDLREWCARGLPEFMVPTAFVLLDTLPVTANGKGVDRKALPAPDMARPELATQYSSPTEGTQAVLAEIWREVLKVDRVGADDNFFALGGDSFLGMQVIAKARRRGMKLTPRVLFQNPTIAELAGQVTSVRKAPATVPAGPAARPGTRRFAVLGSVDGGRDTRVAAVELNDSTAQRTLFAFHEGGGNVSGYVHLADALAPVVRVVGIESRSVGFGAEPEGDVVTMAGGYWEAIRSLQPAGPYLLAGYSFGGALALETARLAAEAGERVELLVALDSCLPVEGAMELIERDHTAVSALLARLTETGVTQRDLARSAEVEKLMGELNLPVEMLALQRTELVDHLRTMEAHTRAVYHYQPPKVDCPVLLYQAESSPWTLPIAESWAPFVGDIDARTSPGDHLTFLRPPHVAVMAREITEAFTEHAE